MNTYKNTMYIHIHSYMTCISYKQGTNCLPDKNYSIHNKKISVLTKFSILFISIVSYSTLWRLDEFLPIAMDT